jgi:transposase-like protein
MRSPTFDELFAMLLAVRLCAADLARLREWIASATQPDECIALIEQAAAGRPCPHCGCARTHRCGQASGLQRFRCLGCGRSHNALYGRPPFARYFSALLRRGKSQHYIRPCARRMPLAPMKAADPRLILTTGC